MKTIKGNILEIKSGVIVHQVNCQRKAGKGLALQIRNKWPKWYEAYLQYDPTPGDIFLFTVAPKLFLGSLYAQERYGRGLQTDYFLLESALKKLQLLLLSARLQNEQVYFPRLGAGLGGGDWNVIEPLIEKYFPNAVLVQKK